MKIKINSLIAMLLLFVTSLPAQSLIAGIITDTDGKPIMGVAVEQTRNDRGKCSYSDVEGAFHFILEPSDPAILYFSKIGYESVQVEGSGLQTGSLEVTLHKSTEKPTNYFRRGYKHRGGGLYGIVDIMNDDFDAFESILGEENVYTLNRMAATFNLEWVITRKRMHYGFLVGLLFTSNPNPDSIDIELNNSVFGINIGYKLINSKRIHFMPNVAFKWYKYRLINFTVEEETHLEQFISAPDLDLRFWQPTAFAGGTLAYKFKGKNKSDNKYWTLGLYGGYIFKLRESVHVRGVRSYVESDARIDLKPFNLGIFASVNVD